MRNVYFAALSLLAIATAITVTAFALDQHHNFLTIACDSAVEQCAIVNTLHGNFFCNNGAGGPSILGAHTTFILLLLSPIYAVAPSIDTLFALQVWGVYSVVIPLFLVSEQLLRRPFLAFFAGCASIASPLLFHMALSPFHPETWILTAAFWSYYFYLRQNFFGYCTSILFAVCCGEEAALIYISLGLCLLLTNDALVWRKQYGMLALIAGFAWVILSIATSALFSRTVDTFNIFAYHYNQWDVKGVWDLPAAVARNPFYGIGYLFDASRWQHLLALLGLPLVGALLTWRSFILLAPLPVYFLMDDQEYFLYFHAYFYAFAFFSGYLGILCILCRFANARRSSAFILTAVFLINIALLCPTVSFYLQMNACRDDEFSKTLRGIFSQIPTRATVYCPHRYSAYLSNREYIVIGDLRENHLDFTSMMDAERKITNVKPEQVDYIVCDYMTDQCGWRFGFLSKELLHRREANINSLLQTGQWQIFWSQNNVIVLSRIHPRST